MGAIGHECPVLEARDVALKDGSFARIRPAELSDAEALLAHVNTVGAEEIYILSERTDRTPEEERDWIRKFDRETSLLLVAIRDGSLVGAMDIARGAQRKNSHVAALGIAIQASARGLGLGAEMLRSGIEWSRSKQIRKLTLSVFASNARAIAVYRKLGFEEEGRLKDQVILRGTPTDLVFMSLWNSSPP